MVFRLSISPGIQVETDETPSIVQGIHQSGFEA